MIWILCSVDCLHQEASTQSNWQVGTQSNDMMTFLPHFSCDSKWGESLGILVLESHQNESFGLVKWLMLLSLCMVLV